MTFLEFLKINIDKKIFVDPCSGNNGDLLIWHGMQEALKKAQTILVDDHADADLIIVNGGGMFIDAYKQGIGKITFYSELYPEKPLCIAPNSFHFKIIDFGSVLDIRKAPLTLFSREVYSKKYIDDLVVSRPLVESYLDNDLAFHLIDSEMINKIKKQYPLPIKGRVLVVDRMDLEHASAGGNSSLIKKLYISLIPEMLKKEIRKYRFKKRNQQGSALTRKARNKILELKPNYSFSAIETSDISRIDICDFSNFVKKIANSDYVFTNRLHVGVLAHLLGRNVFMVEGSYHKMTGIYELSMKDCKTTNILVDNE